MKYIYNHSDSQECGLWTVVVHYKDVFTMAGLNVMIYVIGMTILT